LKIVLIVGRIRAGKDTVAGELQQHFWTKRKKTHLMSFSDSLAAVLDIYDAPRDERRYFQEFANALKTTSFGIDIFGRAVSKKLRECEEGGIDIVLLCGARFVENLEVVRDYPHFTIGVEAESMVRYLREKKKNPKLTQREFEEMDTDFSEGDIDELMRRARVKIENNRSLGELATKVYSLAQQILEL
jgi:hypothetical protein